MPVLDLESEKKIGKREERKMTDGAHVCPQAAAFYFISSYMWA
jgi:hypothetical protein